MCRQVLTTTSDRPHIAAFILPCGGRGAAPHRSCATLRQTAIRQKLRSSVLAAGCVQVHCSQHAGSWPAARVSCVAGSTEGRTHELRPLCLLFADRAKEGDKRTILGL